MFNEKNLEKGSESGVVPLGQKGLEIPDLDIKRAGEMRKQNFDFTYNENAYRTELLFERYNDEIMPNKLVVVDFRIKDVDNNDEEAGVFNFMITKGPILPKYQNANNEKLVFCNIYNREVSNEYKGRGLGELGIKVVEDIAKMVGEKNPELRADFVELNEVTISSLIRLAIDQKWLEDHGLNQYKNNKGRDMHFIPDGDEQAETKIKAILESNTDYTHSKKAANNPEVRLIKKITE